MTTSSVDVSAATARLAMRGVGVRFGAQTALAGVDFCVQPGEIVALVGENGAGKSTLMRVLAGAIQADVGELLLDGERYAPRSPADGRTAGVAMIHQELSLAPHLSVVENIVLGREPRRGAGLFLDRKAARQRARSALAELGHADLPLDRKVGELPIAAAQVTEIARALASGCRVLVLDEPTTSLGSADVARLFERVRALAANGVAVVYVSHVLEELAQLCERFVVLRDGAVVASGDPRKISARDLVGHMVGRSIDELYPRSVRSSQGPLLELDALRAPGVSAASLTLRRGEVLGIAGLVGAGRTELCCAIQGLAAVHAGRVRLATAGSVSASSEGGWVRKPRATPHARWRQGVGLVAEDRKHVGLSAKLSISENLCLPRLDRVSAGGLLTRRGVERAASPWLKKLGVRGPGPAAQARALSGGNQQKVALARLFFADVDVLLLDEPTRGVDVAAKAEIYRWIDALACGSDGQAKKGVLVVSSYLPELFGIADRIAVMCRGRLGAARPVAERNQHEVLLEATGHGPQNEQPE